MIIAGTGHRPDKLGGYDQEIFDNLVKFLEILFIKEKPKVVITGLALGLDQALAQAVINTNQNLSKFLKIKLIGAVPFKGQENAWSEESKIYYRNLLEQCDQVHIISEGDYSAAKMMKRNKWMVDGANIILALWDGSPGGTGNCVKYAESVKKPVINVWEGYQKFLKNN